jgi:PAS domain S-box-containing protein
MPDRKRLRLLDDVPALVRRMDAANACDFCNQAWLDFTGRSLEQELGRGWTEGIHPDDRDRCLAAYQTGVEAGRHVSTRYRLRRRDGRYRHVLERGRPRLDPDGRAAGFLVCCIDVTDMQEAQDRLQRALDEKNALLREVQHRLRNNLQLVASLLALQADATATPEARTELDEAAARVRSIALAQERPQHSGAATEIDFTAYLRALVDSVGSMAEPDTVRFEFAGEPVRLPLDRAIPAGLATNELLTNALEHAFPQADGTVRVELHRDGDAVVVTVADNGIGLPDEIDINRPRSLGMRLLKRLATQARASLEVERHRGTRFRLVLGPGWR